MKETEMNYLIPSEGKVFLQRRDKNGQLIEAMEFALDQLMAFPKIKGPLFFLVPRSMFLERILCLPSSQDQELSMMAHLQALQDLPIDEDDFYSFIFPQNKQDHDGQTSMWVSIFLKEHLHGNLSPLLTGGVVPKHLVFRVQAVFHWFFSIWKPPSKESEASWHGLVWVHEDEIEVALGRGVDLEKSTFLKIEDGAPQKVADFFRFQPQDILNEQVELNIVGALPWVSAIDSKLKEYSFNTETFENDQSMDKSLFQELGENYKRELPGLAKVEEAFKRRLSFMRLSWIFFVMFILLLGGIHFKSRELDGQISHLNKSLRGLEKISLELRNKKDVLDVYHSYDQRRGKALMLFDALLSSTPKTIQFHQVAFSKGKKVTLRGVSKQSILGFVQKLEKIKWVKNLNIKNQNRDIETKKIDFLITFEIHPKEERGAQ